jgi:hypothetical protein
MVMIQVVRESATTMTTTGTETTMTMMTIPILDKVVEIMGQKATVVSGVPVATNP